MTEKQSSYPQEHYSHILDFWFGNLEHLSNNLPSRLQMWFQQDDKLDLEISDKFQTILEKAGQGEFLGWKDNPRGRLALILILDQFPRHIFRGSHMAFQYDPLALALAIEGIELGHDKKLTAFERTFFYLPLEHSEDLKIQEQSVKCFEQLAIDAPTELKTNIESFTYYAARHRDLIIKFGRFPYRNQALNRTSTEKELEYLKGPLF